jgi:hypothetical protein
MAASDETQTPDTAAAEIVKDQSMTGITGATTSPVTAVTTTDADPAEDANKTPTSSFSTNKAPLTDEEVKARKLAKEQADAENERKQAFAAGFQPFDYDNSQDRTSTELDRILNQQFGMQQADQNLIKYVNAEAVKKTPNGFTFELTNGSTLNYSAEKDQFGKTEEFISKKAHWFGGMFMPPPFDQNDANAMVALAATRGWHEITIFSHGTSLKNLNPKKGTKDEKDLKDQLALSDKIWLAVQVHNFEVAQRVQAQGGHDIPELGIAIKGFKPLEDSPIHAEWNKIRAEMEEKAQIANGAGIQHVLPDDTKTLNATQSPETGKFSTEPPLKSATETTDLSKAEPASVSTKQKRNTRSPS